MSVETEKASSDILETERDFVLKNNEINMNLGQEEDARKSYDSETQRNVYRKTFKSEYWNALSDIYDRALAQQQEFERVVGNPEKQRGGQLPPLYPDSELEVSELAENLLDVTRENIEQLTDELQKNADERERLEKRLSSGHSENKLKEREYRRQQKEKSKKGQVMEKGLLLMQARQAGRLLFDDKNMKKDKDSAYLEMMINRGLYKSVRRIKKNMRSIRNEQSVYRRLKFKEKRDALISKEGRRLKHEQGRILVLNRQIVGEDSNRKISILGNRAAIREANRKAQQRNRQRERLEWRMFKKAERGRRYYQHRLNKISRKERRIARKRNMTVISSLISIIGTLSFVFLVVVLFLMSFFNMFAHITGKTVTQNDYATLTDVTGYLRDLETNVKKRVTTERIELQKELDENFFDQNNRHVHEFIYQLPEFGFNDITLMAYLSSKFYTFDLAAVQAELEELCNLMYRMNLEFREEERTFYNAAGNPYTEKVIICYITIDKTELEEVAESRLDEEALEQYKAYKISGGGQQVYGPVMDIDWSGKISSNFGERIHPITGKKTFHDGVDIAVPTGTRLYAAITGQVVTAHYSTSAGNMVTIRTDSGWEVTYMHMDSLNVNAGQYILKGQLIGYSGNTGNSTGPHLHIQVHDIDGRRINPIFIIPQSGVTYN